MRTQLELIQATDSEGLNPASLVRKLITDTYYDQQALAKAQEFRRNAGNGLMRLIGNVAVRYREYQAEHTKADLLYLSPTLEAAMQLGEFDITPALADDPPTGTSNPEL